MSHPARDASSKPDNLSSRHRPSGPIGSLREPELFWCKHQKWLEECGFMLRPRYLPGWVPSWEGTNKHWDDCEDGKFGLPSHMLDATRITDGKFVMMKWIKKSSHPYEADIATIFSSSPLSADPHNHCVPIYATLQVPDEEDKLILVMPLLRKYNNPRFDTIGEAVEFFRQIFEGLQFMHNHHVAHRDCMDLNTMMDPTPLFPEPYHPCEIELKRDVSGTAKHLTRTQRPVKYYLTDFGIARQYSPDNTAPLEDPIWGGDKTVPEFLKSDEPCNPFHTDIYYIGNLIREDFMKGSEFTPGMYGFEFMEALVADMVQDDPAKRPTMDEVVARFEVIRNGLSSWKLRSCVVKRDDNPVLGFFRGIAHWTRRIGFILRRVPPIPTA